MKDTLRLDADTVYVAHCRLIKRIGSRLFNSLSLFIVSGLFMITISIMVSLILLIAEDVHRNDIVVWTILTVFLGFKAILVISAIRLDKNALVELILLDDRILVIYQKYNRTQLEEIYYPDLKIRFKTSGIDKLGSLTIKNKTEVLKFYSGGCVNYADMRNIAEYINLELVGKEKIKPEQIRIS